MMSWSSLLRTKTCILLAYLCVVVLQGSCEVREDNGHCLSEESTCSVGPGVNFDKRYRVESTGGANSAESDKDKEGSLPDDFLHRSIQGLEGMFDQMANSKDQVIKRLDTMMDKMSESKDKMMESLDSVMHKMSESREKVMEKVREGIDKVAHSKMMEEIDHVIETVAHSKVMEEIRALPREIRESFILSVRNRSYLIGGLMVAISAAILLCGAVYYAWCHHDAWSYHIGTIEDAKALLKKAKESAEKCVSSASMASSRDFPSELCNMTSRGCQGEVNDSGPCLKEQLDKNSVHESQLAPEKAVLSSLIASDMTNDHLTSNDIDNDGAKVKGSGEPAESLQPSFDKSRRNNSCKVEGSIGQSNGHLSDGKEETKLDSNGQVSTHAHENYSPEGFELTSGGKDVPKNAQKSCLKSSGNEIVNENGSVKRVGEFADVHAAGLHGTEASGTSETSTCSWNNIAC